MNIPSLLPLLSPSVSLRVRCGRARPRPQTATSSSKAANLPCRFLPLLPPRTRNVTLPDRANRLEFGVSTHCPVTSKLKSGKNGNVDHPSQHCHPIAASPQRHARSPHGLFPAGSGQCPSRSVSGKFALLT